MTTSLPQLSNPNRVELTQLEFDRRLVWAYRSSPETAIAAIGLLRVLEAIGIKRVIEVIGIEKIAEYFVEKYGRAGFLALIEKHEQQVSELFDPSPVGVLPPPTPRAE